MKEDQFLSRDDAQGTGNLFSHFIVKGILLNKDFGSIGFVVPLSFACGDNYEKVRSYVFHSYKELFASHYSIRPAKLFPGVDQRITLFFTKGKTLSQSCSISSSRLWRWNPGSEEFVVNNPDLGFLGKQSTGFIPKVAGNLGTQIYESIISAPVSLGKLMGGGVFTAYYHGIARYWIKTYDFIPYFRREGEGLASQSSTLGSCNFPAEFNKYLFLLLTNSSLFYYWWITRSDEFHVLPSDFIDFGLSNLAYFQDNSLKVTELVKKLMADYQNNSKRSTGNAGGKRINFDVFYPKKSFAIIHRIDDFIADGYGFSKQTNDFIKCYDIEYRSDE